MSQAPTIHIHGFETRYKFNPATGQNDLPVDYVTYSPRFGAQSLAVTDAIHRMRPDQSRIKGTEQSRDMKFAFLKMRWDMIEPAYEAFKKGNEIPESGTPLGAWPGVTSNQADGLRKMGIRTVEEVRDMPDGQMGRIPFPGIRDLKKQAGTFLDASDRNATSTQMSDLKSQNEAMSERLEAAMAMIDELSKEKVAATKKAAPKKESEAA